MLVLKILKLITISICNYCITISISEIEVYHQLVDIITNELVVVTLLYDDLR